MPDEATILSPRPGAAANLTQHRPNPWRRWPHRL